MPRGTGQHSLLYVTLRACLVQLTPAGHMSPTHLPRHSKLGDLPAGHALCQVCDLRALLPVVKLGQLQAPGKEELPSDARAPARPRVTPQACAAPAAPTGTAGTPARAGASAGNQSPGTSLRAPGRVRRAVREGQRGVRPAGAAAAPWGCVGGEGPRRPPQGRDHVLPRPQQRAQRPRACWA